MHCGKTLIPPLNANGPLDFPTIFSSKMHVHTISMIRILKKIPVPYMHHMLLVLLFEPKYVVIYKQTAAKLVKNGSYKQ